MSQEVEMVPDVVSSCSFDLQSVECSDDSVVVSKLAPLLISASWEEIVDPTVPAPLVLTFLDQDTVPELKLLQAFFQSRIESLQLGTYNTEGQVCALNTFTGVTLQKVARAFDAFAEEGAISTRIATFTCNSVVETISE